VRFPRLDGPAGVRGARHGALARDILEQAGHDGGAERHAHALLGEGSPARADRLAQSVLVQEPLDRRGHRVRARLRQLGRFGLDQLPPAVGTVDRDHGGT
jgi:hypothetical protein